MYRTRLGVSIFLVCLMTLFEVGLPCAPASAGTVSLNGACLAGDCGSPSTLPYGGSSDSPFSGIFTVNGDKYSISGDLSTSSPSYLSFGISFKVTYLGSSPTTGTDSAEVVTFESFDNPFGSNCCLWSTGFSGAANANVGSGSTVYFQNTVNGTSYNAGPYATNSSFGTGYQTFYAQNSDPLPDTFAFGLDFASGTKTGAQIAINEAVSGVPEPSTWAMMLIGFAGLGFAGYRKARTADAALAA